MRRVFASALLPCLCVFLSAFACLGQQKEGLVKAIEESDLTTVKSLLAANPDWLKEELPRYRAQPLHVAIRTGKVEVVTELLKLAPPLGTDNRAKTSALHVSLQNRNAKITQLLLDANNDPNLVDRNGNSLLSFAIMNRHNPLATAKVLMEAGADVNVKSRSNQTPLHLAIYYRRLDCALELIKRGADITAKDNNQNTPLLIAAMSLPELIEELIDRGASLDAVNRQGQGVLHNACQSQGTKAVTVLMEHVSDVNPLDVSGRTPLALAVFRNNLDVAKLLLSRGADPDLRKAGVQQFDLPIHHASRNGMKEMARLLLDNGANPNLVCANEDTPLHLAASIQGTILAGQAGENQLRQRFTEVIDLLLKKGADANRTNKSGRTPLIIAAEQGFYDAVNRLVDVTRDLEFELGDGSMAHWGAEHGIAKLIGKLAKEGKLQPENENSAGQTVLQVAAKNGRSEIVKFLIQQKASVSHVDQAGLTALGWAASEGHAGVCESLIRAGADFKSADESGQTPLHVAAWRGSEEVVAVLLRNGELDDFQSGPVGYSPLHAAAWNGHEQVLRQLLTYGMNPNVMDSDGWTPLHKAAYRGHEESVRYLLQQGADKGIRNSVGMTPQDLVPIEKSKKMDAYFR